MAGIPEVLDALNKIKSIHEKKNADYAGDGKPFENFERSAELASWFNKHPDVPFAVLIGTKLARLATLLNSEKEPNNESIDDSFLDLATYSILWWSSYQRRIKAVQPIGMSTIAKICPNCSKEFVHTGYRTNRGEFCSTVCLTAYNLNTDDSAILTI